MALNVTILPKHNITSVGLISVLMVICFFCLKLSDMNKDKEFDLCCYLFNLNCPFSLRDLKSKNTPHNFKQKCLPLFIYEHSLVR